jgi:hypothetical protein
MESEEIDFDSPEFAQAVATAKPVEPMAEIKFDEIVNVETQDDEAETTTTEATETAAVTESTATTETTKHAVTAEPNYAEYLSTKSGGLFKSEEDFIAALEKVKNYDSVELRAKELETKIPKFKDDEAKAWFDLVQSEDGTKALKEYISEKEKDYKTMSDVDIMKNALKAENPAWDNKRIELELRHKYGTNLTKIDTANLDPEDDKEELKEANAHNNEVEKNLELLQMHAFDKRVSLLNKQSKLTLPEIQKAETDTKETQETPEQAAERIAKWQEKVEDTVPKLSNFKIDIDDKGVEYVWTDDEKAALVSEMKNFNIFKWMQSEGWTNADNSWNPDKIAEGVRFLRDKNKVIASVASQVKTEAIRATMAKIKGIDPNYREPGPAKVYNSLEEAAQAKLKELRAKENNVEREEAD